VHLLEQRRAFPEEFLPCRILRAFARASAARVQAGIRPDVADFVRLACLGLPQADDFGIFLASRQRSGERIEPLPDRAASLRAIIAEFVRRARRYRATGAFIALSRRPPGAISSG